MKQSVFYRPQTKFAKVTFFTCVCHSVHRGRGSPGPHPGGVEGSGWGVFRPTPKEEVEGSGSGGLQAHTRGGLQAHTRGVCRPTPGGGSAGPHPEGRGCITACTEADTPPSRRLLRAVRILMECILVLCHDFRLIPPFPVLFTLGISHILGVFHAPVSGLYLLSVYATTGNDAGYLFIKKNDKDICRTWITAGQSPADDVGHDKGTCTGITELTPGDSVRVTGNTDDPARIQGSDSGFIGHLIQPYC